MLFRSPTQLVRIVDPLEGTPRIQVVCDPKLGWSKSTPAPLQGSHHIRYEGFASQLRLTTDLPLSYLNGEPFTLTGRRHLMLTWGAPVEEPQAARRPAKARRGRVAAIFMGATLEVAYQQLPETFG